MQPPRTSSIWSTLYVVLLTLVTIAGARDPAHPGRQRLFAERMMSASAEMSHVASASGAAAAPILPRQVETPLVTPNLNTSYFRVNGAAIPEVDWDIGESYAGTIPVARDPNTALYFWYVPTANEAGKNDIVIWLNGGPGCSSLEGFLQENGPFLWNYGTFKPVKNQWSWSKLANVLWVEQPVGTGFSVGSSTEKNEEDVAKSFISWFRNFVDTFGLHGRKIYLAGESYAGFYVPYIADAMFNASNKDYYDVQGVMIYDPSINSDAVQSEVTAVQFVQNYDNVFRLNSTFMAEITEEANTLGHQAYLDKYLTFPPPKGPFPQPIGVENNRNTLWSKIKLAASLINPCFNMYHILTSCPLLWDVLGFPGSFEYNPAGSRVYFDRADVKRAINAPASVQWAECNAIALSYGDGSDPVSWAVLPRVIDRAARTLLAHGSLDWILQANGSLLSVQNMTWGGAQGFRRRPAAPFYVPYHRADGLATVAGAGVQGVTHTERKLTWVEVWMSGHMIPQYAPAAAFRHLEYLLGRIASLSDTSPFTIEVSSPQTGWAGFSGGNGTDR